MSGPLLLGAQGEEALTPAIRATPLTVEGEGIFGAVSGGIGRAEGAIVKP